ncbi:MAG: hypothetical protein LBF27_32900 [Sphingobacterium sp.]|nr:hypothetical protein [Sphingobacterium sp.]
MKNTRTAIIGITILLLSILGCKQSVKPYAEAPLQLKGVSMDLDLSKFLGNEDLFRGKVDQVNLDAEENEIVLERKDQPDSTVYYVQYNINSNKGNINLADYGNFKFKTLELLTDLAEKEVFVWMAEQEEVTAEDINKLVDQITSDNPEATMNSRELETISSGLRLIWHTKDKVFQIVLPEKEALRFDRGNEPYYPSYDENGNPIEEKEAFSKEQIIALFKEKQQDSLKNKVTFFIAKPQFDEWFRDNSPGSRGTMTRYD